MTAPVVEYRCGLPAVPQAERHPMCQKGLAVRAEAPVPAARIPCPRPPVARPITIQVDPPVEEHRHGTRRPQSVALRGAVEALAVRPPAVRPPGDWPTTNGAPLFGGRAPDRFQVALGGAVLGDGHGKPPAAAGAGDLYRATSGYGVVRVDAHLVSLGRGATPPAAATARRHFR